MGTEIINFSQEFCIFIVNYVIVIEYPNCSMKEVHVMCTFLSSTFMCFCFAFEFYSIQLNCDA